MRTHSASLLAIGNELTSGLVPDTNSSFLAQTLTDIGFSLESISLTSDKRDDIASELSRLLARSSLIITTGGLGPTSDDITREVVSYVAERPLELSVRALEKLERRAKQRGRQLTEISKRQAFFPQGAELIENPVGTADAFALRVSHETGDDKYIVSLPGVPFEMKEIVETQLSPWLKFTFPGLHSTNSSTIRCFGISESHIGSVIESLSLPEGLEVAYRPSFPVVSVRFTAVITSSPEEAIRRTDKAARMAREALGAEFVFSCEPTEPLAGVVAKLLIERNLKLAVSESCTGGRIADSLVAVPGASEFFLSSVVSYSNSAKEILLGVERSLFERFGAVSREVALAMAGGVKNKTGADLSLATTGIAGPSGGSTEKPVGTVWIGLITEDSEDAFEYHFPTSRDMFRTWCSYLALDLVRRKLLDYPLTWTMR